MLKKRKKEHHRNIVVIDILFQNINQRCILMEDVATYKYIHHVPIFDLARERNLLEDMVRIAVSEGINSIWAYDFIGILLDISKQIQQRFYDIWFQNKHNKQMFSNTFEEVRDKITRCTKEILHSAVLSQSVLINKNSLPEIQKSLKENIIMPLVSSVNKKCLLESLVLIKLS